jgi:hypothetical protein
MRTWTEYGVTFVTGAGKRRTVLIEGPEPEHVAQYVRKRVDGRMVADMDALRQRTVRATEWRTPSAITLEALKRKAVEC